MTMSTREEVFQHIQTVGYLQPALYKPTHAPAPDEVNHALYRAYIRGAHDVGGEPDVPITWSEKEEEQWKLNTFATCECLGTATPNSPPCPSTPTHLTHFRK